MNDAYRSEIDSFVQELSVDPIRGLTDKEAEERRLNVGPNELAETAAKTVWMMFFDQFKDFLVLLLLAAAVVSAFVGEVTDAIVILLVVGINAVLGVVQEFRAEKSLSALKKLASPQAKVIRAGHVVSLPARELVPGDLVILEAGDFVPADLRLIETANLKINEAALTGESVPVDKDADWKAAEEVGLADRKNMAFMGTVATYGRGRGLVASTGMKTEIGQIATMIQAVETEETPLQRKLDAFGRQLGIIAIVLCVVIFLVGIARQRDPFEMFLTAVSLAVAAIPEGLPAIVTIVLAMGVQRMAKNKAIIRKLPAVETLGSATVICSDKTGTLTQNAMTVRELHTWDDQTSVSGEGYQPTGAFKVLGQPIDPKERQDLWLLLKAGLLCSDARLQEDMAEGQIRYSIVGDPTEGALIVAAAKADLKRENLEEELPRVLEFPFDSDRKRMTTVHRGSLRHTYLESIAAETWGITKGAPDMILDVCDRYITADGIRPLDEKAREALLAKNKAMATQALRVLGFAVKPLPTPEKVTIEEAENALIFIGFMGMIDPPRREAAEAIRICREAGIKPVMITGDHRDTAVAIGLELGLMDSDKHVMTGEALNSIDREALEASVKEISVYARVSPEHKVRIVDAFRRRGEIVAMTGDGVNDAPALKKADIGAAMGITGTDVAKEAADMVLADDNFATVVAAVKEGRIIFDNIRKAVFFLLSCNIGEILTVFAAILVGLPSPLLPIQILWVNLVTDSLPALALGVDPAEGDIMRRKPRNPQQGIFTTGSKRSMVVLGAFVGCITLVGFLVGWLGRQSVEEGRTIAFATLGMSQLFHVFNFRSLRGSLFRRGVFGNPQLVAAVLVSVALQFAVFFISPLAKIFKVVPLVATEWLLVIGLSASTILFGEFWKAVWIRPRTEE